MRKYEVNGKLEVLRTLPSEITLEDFTQVVMMQGNNFVPDYNYYLNFFHILGLSNDYLDIMDIDNLISTIKDFQEDFKLSDTVSTIEVDGKVYTASERLKARDFASTEARMRQDPSWMAYLMTKIFHTDGEYIVESEALKLTMDVCLPHIVKISTKYVENFRLDL